MSDQENPQQQQEEVNGEVAKTVPEVDASHIGVPLSGTVDPKMLEDLLAQRFRALATEADTPAPAMHNFWNTQPVPKLDEKVNENNFIEPPVPKSEIRQTPYPLPNDFKWVDVDLTSTDELHELYTLLSLNYVEDDDNMFRFDYGADFLKWALMPPGWKKQWHCGIRVASSNKLVAFIGAIPLELQVIDKVVKSVEINFLCAHKKLRNKRLAPLLIKEITRRVNLTGIFQAAFTAGVVIPKPIARCRYYHRTLNPKKLIETGFSALARNMTMARTIKLYKVNPEPKHNLIPLEKKHIKSAFKLVTDYLAKYKLHPLFSEKEFAHFFLPRPEVVYSFVIVDANHQVTDICSFYNLPSTVVNHPLYKTIKAAYSFYNVATTIPLKDLMNDALTLAKKADFDVFNALDLMENSSFLSDLKFGIGDGLLQYYLYNWKCPDLDAKDVAFVLQ